MTFKLTVVEIAVDNFMGVLEEADTFSMRSIDFSFSQIDNFLILKKFGSVEGGLGSKYQRRAILDNKQLLHFELNVPQLSSNKGGLIVEIIKIKLCFFQHFFFTIFIDFQFTAHPADKDIEGFVHFFDGFEFASFNLL